MSTRRGPTNASGLVASLGLPHGRLHDCTIRVVRVAPERVDEDPHRSASRPDVFDLAAREPIVNGPAADADKLAGLHDRNSFSFHRGACLRGMYRRNRTGGLESKNGGKELPVRQRLGG